MNWLDLVILAFIAGAVGNGYRRGFSLSALSYGGLVAGTAMGAVIAPLVERVFGAGPSTGPFIGLGILFITASIGSSVGFALGEPLRHRVEQLQAARLDAGAGAVFSMVSVLATSWFLGLALGRVQPVAGAIRGSGILRSLDSVFPRPPGFLTGVEQILSGVPYPRVFDVLNPDLPGPVTVDPAVADKPGVVEVAHEVVKVRSVGCGGEVFGSAFPVADNYLITNAHVVAGTLDTRVVVPAPDGRSRRATVVLFDAERDVAILLVPDLHLNSPAGADGRRGTRGATIGYPGGGSEVVGAAAVRTKVTAVGRDIYGTNQVARQIYVLTASIHPGNSGGPLVDEQGRALGVVFANSTTDPTEGYALTDAEVAPDIAAGTVSTRPVSTETCAQ
jgi:S1-C subfamily serine protease